MLDQIRFLNWNRTFINQKAQLNRWLNLLEQESISCSIIFVAVFELAPRHQTPLQCLSLPDPTPHEVLQDRPKRQFAGHYLHDPRGQQQT
jgi:hypothetical protein